MLVKLPGDHWAQTVGGALISAFAHLPSALRRTLTWDQVNEMLHHERIETSTGMRIYFADPHSPWQRATNENTNGLLRQYLPKSTDSNCWSQEELDDVGAKGELQMLRDVAGGHAFGIERREPCRRTRSADGPLWKGRPSRTHHCDPGAGPP